MSKRIIAENIALSNNTYETHLNNNDMIIGASGGGKTGSYVVPYILNTDESFIVTDTKSNLYRNYRKSLENRGYCVYNIDLANPSCSGGYNPLTYVGSRKVNGRKIYSEKDILSIAYAIIPILSEREPFWEQQAQMLLGCLISYVLDVFDKKDKNLASVADVAELMFSCIHNKSVPFLEEHCVMYPDSLTARKFGLLKSTFDSEKTWGCVEMFLATAIDVFNFDCTRELLSKPTDFRFEDLGRKKCAVFLNVSDTDRSLDPIINLFYTQAFQILCKEADKQPDSRLKIPVKIIMDDFATNTRIPNFDKIISVVRSREISVSIILQSLSQLESVYSNAQKWTIVNNCDNILFLGGTDLSTIYYIAERAKKSPEDVMGLELDKAYFIQRGMRSAMKVNKIPPYSMVEAELEEDDGEVYTLADTVEFND